MNIDIPELIVSLLFSAVGFVYFSYGKRMSKPEIVVCGIALMGYSYFVDSVGVSILVGLALSITPFAARWW